jgi:hypothetical protein
MDMSIALGVYLIINGWGFWVPVRDHAYRNDNHEHNLCSNIMAEYLNEGKQIHSITLHAT